MYNFLLSADVQNAVSKNINENIILNPAFIVSLSALAISVLSPFITAAINNRHERKMFRLHFYEQHRAEVIEAYVSSAGRCIYGGFMCNDVAEFGSICGEIFTYIDSAHWDLISQLNYQIQISDSKNAIQSLKELSQIIAFQNVRYSRKENTHINKHQNV